mgnify:CR=1 FL=1
MELSKTELNNISGGAVSAYFIFGGIVTFVIGFIDGFTRPLKCNK